MKELLDTLEARVSSLLDERDLLRRENETLREELERAEGPLREELDSLREELDREKAVREVATQRIDALLLRVKERIPE
ncbi:cell division protein ZapB [Desulfovibrio sp. OttesenSCG-928-I05]|nr:cell division protein ZapB [Desulfovibrio sp. OttesenSCG-928-I05]